MTITLKNGKNIDLEWSFLVLEYLEEYEGGIKQLKKDITAQKNLMKIHNHFLYAIVRANYDEVLTYRQAVSLVNFKDSEKIAKFIQDNLEELEEFKKKRSEIYSPGNEEEKINWAEIKYCALQMGLSEREFMKINPIVFYQMLDYHVKLERSKYHAK